jgi:5-(carboxyamino)imidazole ribonucleotide mutase
MPGGIPVGTLAIGDAGAKNAALLAIRVLARSNPELRQKLIDYHQRLAAKVLEESQL